MDKIYYLFSCANEREALFLCKDNNSIDKPYIKSAVYPIGIIFSKAMKTIVPAIDAASALLSPCDLLGGLSDFAKNDSSFSSIACNDEGLKMIFYVLLGDNKELYSRSDITKMINILTQMNNYLSSCAEKKYLESIPNYHSQLSTLKVKLPTYTIFDGNSYDVNNISSKSSKEFSPQLSGMPKPLFGSASNTFKTEQYGKLMLPLYVYEIDFITDLLMSTMEQIFENNFVIGKCKFCQSYFVSENKRNKYCPPAVPELKKETCYCIAHRKREKSLCNDEIEIQRTYNSVRNMLMRKRNLDIQDDGENNKRYEAFKQKNKEYRRSIILGKFTLDEYHNWLKSYYVYKYKK